MSIPRPEHPNPQWERVHWRNLNGEWDFDFDLNKSLREQEVYRKGVLSKKITVPFCPESDLARPKFTDFIPAVCYKKSITLSEKELMGNVFLHFGAVDYHSFIYINGNPAGEHIGGYSSFSVDITSFVTVGENVIFVIAEDEVRSGLQPSGKQSNKYHSYGCRYTRTTGIWQTVWLEFVPKAYVKSCKYYPDITNKTLTVTGEVEGSGELELVSSYEGRPTGSVTLFADGSFCAQIVLSELHLWEIGHGRLYDLEIRFGEDVVNSYFGMREVAIDQNKFLLNKKPVFLRMVLDQGFYPDGIYTAKSDEELKRDILLAKKVGFQGARLHQKVFEKRFLYHCDKEGYLVWGEHANWGMDYTNGVSQMNFLCEWMEIIERDFNSPAVIGWCPFNETWGYQEQECDSRLIEGVYRVTKLYDKTRPCIDTSGNYHLVKKEIYDIHDYEQNPEQFAQNYAEIDKGIVNDQIQRRDGNVQPYFGEPIFMSEYGGIKWPPNCENGWGYGEAPQTLEEFVDRYCQLTEILLSNPYMIGLCYTQLYDIEQEQNGIYYYDRTPKFDEETMEKLKSVMMKKAKIEE